MKAKTSPRGAPPLRRRVARSKFAFSLATIWARMPEALAGERRNMRCGFEGAFPARLLAAGRTFREAIAGPEFLFVFLFTNAPRSRFEGQTEVCPSERRDLFDASPMARGLQKGSNRRS